MKNIELSLQKLGLTTNEIAIYIYLLRNGLRTGSEVYRDNNLDKSSAYEALANLQAKELVYTLGQKRNQKFGAIAAEKLMEMVEQKQHELERVRKDVADLLHDLDDYAKTSYKNKYIRILNGDDSYHKWVEAKHSVKRGEVIREFLSFAKKREFIENFPAYAVQTPKERVQRGIYMKSLTGKSDWEIVSKEFPRIYRTDPDLLKELRYLPEQPNIEIPANFATFGNYTSLLRIDKGEFFGIIIEDRLITGLMNSMFDFIWEYSIEV